MTQANQAIRIQNHASSPLLPILHEFGIGIVSMSCFFIHVGIRVFKSFSSHVVDIFGDSPFSALLAVSPFSIRDDFV